MSSTTTVIFRTPNREQAHLLCQALVEHGITGRVFEHPSHEGALASARVVVFEEQAEDARPIVEDFLTQWVTVDPDAELEEERVLEEHEGRAHMAWRACSQCGAERLITCPACGERQKSFPLADPPPEGKEIEPRENEWPAALRLECPICDDIFEPHDADVCGQCGHSFEHASAAGNGTGDVESIPDDSPWQLSHLLILIVAMIALAILGLYLYGDPNLPRLPLF